MDLTVKLLLGIYNGISAGIFAGTFYELELLKIYSQIIEKTHGWAIISADKEFRKFDAINL